MYWTPRQAALVACPNTRHIDGLSCEIQAPDSPAPDRAIVTARIIAKEANHENDGCLFS